VEVVLLAGVPLQVLRAVVSLVAIDMVDLLLALRVRQERLSHKTVDAVSDAYAVDADGPD
jgi:hypothetical protein